MRKTLIATFPRSGHHLLVRGLNVLLEGQMVYSEKYTSTFDITDPICNVQKTHDFELDEPILPEHKHIVQIREFDDAISSWYNVQTEHFGYTGTLKEFAESKGAYYDGFLRKWMLSGALIVPYNQLREDPAGWVIKAARYMDGNITSHHLKLLERWGMVEQQEGAIA